MSNEVLKVIKRDGSTEYADYNKVFITNIFHKPIKEKFKIYFIDINLKKILYNKEIYTNSLNEIEISLFVTAILNK